MHNVALIGRAGSGKSEVAKIFVEEHNFHKHALADPLKVQLGWIAGMQLSRAPEDFSLSTVFAVARIMRGKMGHGTEGLTSIGYIRDCEVRDRYVGWVNEHKPHFRAALQYYGTETIRNLSREAGGTMVPWLWILLHESENSAALGHRTVVDDCRFPDEMSVLRGQGFVSIRVIRSEGGHVLHDEATRGHASESHWETLPANYTLLNDGTLDDLRAKVRDLIAMHLEERQAA